MIEPAGLEAVAYDGWSAPQLLAALAGSIGRRVRFVAPDGALLAECRPDGRRVDVGGEAARFTGRRTVVLGADDLRRAARSGGGTTVRCADGVAGVAVTVAAGRRQVGALVAECAAADGAGVLDALRTARSAFAIESVRRDARTQALAESASWLVGELRAGSRRPSDELARLARPLGVDLDRPHAAIALRYAGPERRMWTTALSWIEAPAAVEGERAWAVLGGDVQAAARHLRRRLQSFVDGDPVYVAVGSVVTGAAATRRSFDQAEYTLRVAESRGDVEATFTALGLLGLFHDVPAGDLRAHVERALGPLLGHDDLLTTLAAWYRCGGRRAEVAADLNVHRNTVGYRLDRVRRLLGADPSEPGVALELQAALVARDALDVRGERTAEPRSRRSG